MADFFWDSAFFCYSLCFFAAGSFSNITLYQTIIGMYGVYILKYIIQNTIKQLEKDEKKTKFNYSKFTKYFIKLLPLCVLLPLFFENTCLCFYNSEIGYYNKELGFNINT